MNDTPEKKDVVPSAYREKYKATGGTNGDFIATSLSKIADDGVQSLDAVKAENGIEKARWATFNPGMQRMNLANVLRGRFLKGETITILGKQFNAKQQAEDFNGELKDTPAVLAKLAKLLGLNDSDRTTASLSKLFFPPAPKGPTAEERAKAKADKAEAAAKAKADKAAASKKKKDDAAAAKAAKAEATAKAKAAKAATPATA